MTKKTPSKDVTVIPASMPATATPVARNPLDISTRTLTAQLNRRLVNRKLLVSWIWDNLVEGTDWSVIEYIKTMKDGTKKHVKTKPFLHKPGAEKICGMLNLRPVFPGLPNYEQTAMTGTTIETVILRCNLVDSRGNIVADGVGARRALQDDFDINKMLKMAAKSAQIDATLRCGGLSELFTQDPEALKASFTDDPDDPDARIGESEIDYLMAKATKLFPKVDVERLLSSLAMRRFHITDGDWRKIPAHRLPDAIRSLESRKKDDDQ